MSNLLFTTEDEQNQLFIFEIGTERLAARISCVAPVICVGQMRKSPALIESWNTANNWKFPDHRKLQIVNPEVSKEQLHLS